MTERELVQAQLWIWYRERLLRAPQGTRRQSDSPQATVTVWRQQRGWTRTELAVAIKTPGQALPSAVLERIENGTASREERALYHPRIAAAFGVPVSRVQIEKRTRAYDMTRRGKRR